MLSRRDSGQWAEFTASVWLVTNGYEVFTGTGYASCDLVAVRDGKALRVEVKKATRRHERYWSVVGCNPALYDMLLVVTPEGEVMQDPGPDVCRIGAKSPSRGYNRVKTNFG